jgi:hypothetical protein
VGISAAFDLPDSGNEVQIATTNVPNNGSYLVFANVDWIDQVVDENTVICALYHNGNFIGGSTTGIPEAYSDLTQTSLDFGHSSLTGGANAAAGDSISLKCRAEGHDSEPGTLGGQLIIMQIGGFF